MAKRKVRVISAIVIATILLVSFVLGGVALTAENALFKNNTPTYITIGTDVTGSVTSKKDYEAYIFEVPEVGALSYNLAHENFMDSGKAGWICTLYKLLDIEGSNEKEYKEITTQTSFWSDVTSDWKKIGVTPGTYCIIVTPGLYFLESEYTLKTELELSDNYEKEPNDTKETSSIIDVGYGKYGLSSARANDTDIDWYQFDIAKDSCVNISFTHPDGTFPTVGWTVTLMNSAGDKITQFTSRLTDLIIKTGVIGLKSGRYYISVEAQTDSADEYTVLVGAEKAVNFEFEFNDTPEQAINLPQGTPISGCLAERLLSLDKDYYKFTVEGEGYVDLTFTHLLQEGDKNGWNIRVLKELPNGKYTEIVRKVAKWNVETLEIKNLGLSAGDYYVLIDGDSVSYNSATYSITWSFTEKPNFEREPNSDMHNCQTIEIGQKYYGAIISSGTVYDEDYYRFTLNDAKNVCLILNHERFEDSGIYWTMSIIDDKGNVVVKVDSPFNQPITSTGVIEQLPAGVYFVKVETGLYGSEQPYEIQLIG